MNHRQYEDYVARVGAFLADFRHEPTTEGEPFFSRSPCCSCGSCLAGEREEATGVLHDGGTWTGNVCVDCVYFFAYGRLDDVTMDEVEASR